jgi:mono/diheme cytochrome c family protein
MIRRIFGFAALALVLAGPATSKGTLSGVYTAVQAGEGGAIYARQCAMCHGVRLEGTVETPGLTGKFMANWAGRPVGDLFDYIGRAMPQMAPGTLQPEDNARVVAFILQSNGAPAGNSALPADSRALGRLDFDAQVPGR